jgi:triacylglycerol lipase
LTSKTKRGNATPKGLLAPTLGAAALLAMTVMPTAAQTSGMPAEIAARVAAIGPVINPPETAKLYAPLQEKEPYRAIKVTRDVKYGQHDRNLLDVFEPEGAAAAPRPVLIFIHGGGFMRGDRRSPDNTSPFYDNVMVFAARNGIVGVNATYRLAPQHPWPAEPRMWARRCAGWARILTGAAATRRACS